MISEKKAGWDAERESASHPMFEPSEFPSTILALPFRDLHN